MGGQLQQWSSAVVHSREGTGYKGWVVNGRFYKPHSLTSRNSRTTSNISHPQLKGRSGPSFEHNDRFGNKVSLDLTSNWGIENISLVYHRPHRQRRHERRMSCMLGAHQSVGVAYRASSLWRFILRHSSGSFQGRPLWQCWALSDVRLQKYGVTVFNTLYFDATEWCWPMIH